MLRSLVLVCLNILGLNVVCCTVGVKQPEWSFCTSEHHCCGLLCYGSASCTDVFDRHMFLFVANLHVAELLCQEVKNSVASANRAAKAVTTGQRRQHAAFNAFRFVYFTFL